MEQLKKELRHRYIMTYRECQKLGYTPHYFMNMVASDEDVVAVTRKLIHKQGGTEGFTRLAMLGRMDLSVENIILEDRYRPLFSTEDLQSAYANLAKYEYNRLHEILAP